MATRLFVLTALFSLVFAGPLSLPLRAQEEAALPEVPNSKYQFSGLINSNSVNIRSGPSENYYATLKVDKGAPVTVVGIKFDWLKILPPDGSYSVITRQFVTKNPDGTTGTVSGDNVRVRAGSHLTPVKITVQCQLKKGAQVQIIGEQEEYYQIKPPADAYVYVHQKYVEPIKQLPANAIADNAANPGGNPADANAAQTPATQPAEPVIAKAPQDTSAQDAAKAEAEFDRLEAALKTSLEKPLAEQPVDELLQGYETLVKNQNLSITMRRISYIRAIGLKTKTQAKTDLLATRKQQAESTARIDALQAQRQAVEQKLAGLTVYTAVGKLQSSTLQVGAGTLYRLTDPATNHTLCYVRSADANKFTPLLDKFVGIKGDLVSDPQLTLKVVDATDLAAVDPAKVNKGVSAQIIPPSLITKPAQEANTGTN
jgi:uncharacterized protein YgiM (DUF1202 family)